MIPIGIPDFHCTNYNNQPYTHPYGFNNGGAILRSSRKIDITSWICITKKYISRISLTTSETKTVFSPINGFSRALSEKEKFEGFSTTLREKAEFCNRISILAIQQPGFSRTSHRFGQNPLMNEPVQNDLVFEQSRFPCLQNWHGIIESGFFSNHACKRFQGVYKIGTFCESVVVQYTLVNSLT